MPDDRDHAAKALAEINAILDAPPDARQKAPLPDCSRCAERKKTYPDWKVCQVEERVIAGRVYRQALCRACRIATAPKAQSPTAAAATSTGKHAPDCKCTDCARTTFADADDERSLFPHGHEPPLRPPAPEGEK